MDPLSALGLASAIVQFVDFGFTLVSEGRELYESINGATKENFELETITEDLAQLTTNLLPEASHGLPSQNDIALRKLAQMCRDIAKELLIVLESIKVKNKGQKWQSARQAVRSVMKKGEIQSIHGRLQRVQEQFKTHIARMLWNQQSNIRSSVDRLVQSSESLETRMTQTLDSIHKDLEGAIRTANLDHINSHVHNSLDLAELLAAINRVASIIPEFNAEKRRVDTSLTLLKSLRYNSMSTRESLVKDEHKETFRWIFERSPRPEWDFERPKFIEWLESGAGVFWIAGKPGPGKSTLMKYIIHDRITRNALRTWASSNKLVIASHFFWISGNDNMQKSQIGLLRSLLYQALRQIPELILHACASKLEEDSIINDQWTFSELLAAFSRIAKQTWAPVKICFFIDGLDEYDGFHADLIELLQDCATSNVVKICASSRPWNVFQDTFGADKDRRLMLQELTKHDIQIYVDNKLGKNYRFKALSADDKRYEELIQEIVLKAEGVFLWVTLVVHSLLTSLTDENDIGTMQKRVEMVPSDLEEYFQHILEDIDQVYRSQSARIFQLCVHAGTPLEVIGFHFLEKEQRDPQYAIKMESKEFSDDEWISIQRRMKKYLNARSKGLLEVNYYPTEGVSLSYKVGFLHRTVRDFLNRSDMQRIFGSQCGQDFDPFVSLSRMTLAQIKVLRKVEISKRNIPGKLSFIHKDEEIQPEFSILRQRLMQYAKEIELRHERSASDVLNELQCFYNANFEKRVYSSQVPMTRTHDVLKDWEEIYYKTEKNAVMCIVWAVDKGLYLYVAEKLKQNPNLVYEFGDESLLHRSLKRLRPNELEREMTSPPLMAGRLDIGMVRLLLNAKADPNQKFGDHQSQSVWQIFLGSLPESNLEEWKEVVYKVSSMLIEAGADTRVLITTRDRIALGLIDLHPVFEILYRAVSMQRYIKIVRLLLQHGADPNQKDADTGATIWSRFSSACRVVAKSGSNIQEDIDAVSIMAIKAGRQLR